MSRVSIKFNGQKIQLASTRAASMPSESASLSPSALPPPSVVPRRSKRFRAGSPDAILDPEVPPISRPKKIKAFEAASGPVPAESHSDEHAAAEVVSAESRKNSGDDGGREQVDLTLEEADIDKEGDGMLKELVLGEEVEGGDVEAGAGLDGGDEYMDGTVGGGDESEVELEGGEVDKDGFESPERIEYENDDDEIEDPKLLELKLREQQKKEERAEREEKRAEAARIREEERDAREWEKMMNRHRREEKRREDERKKEEKKQEDERKKEQKRQEDERKREKKELDDLKKEEKKRDDERKKEAKKLEEERKRIEDEQKRVEELDKTPYFITLKVYKTLPPLDSSAKHPRKGFTPAPPKTLGPITITRRSTFSEFQEAVGKVLGVPPARVNLPTFQWKKSTAKQGWMPLGTSVGFDALITSCDAHVGGKSKNPVQVDLIMEQPLSGASAQGWSDEQMSDTFNVAVEDLPWNKKTPGKEEDDLEGGFGVGQTPLSVRINGVVNKFAPQLHKQYPINGCPDHPDIHCFHDKSRNLHFNLAPHLMQLKSWAGALEGGKATLERPPHNNYFSASHALKIEPKAKAPVPGGQGSGAIGPQIGHAAGAGHVPPPFHFNPMAYGMAPMPFYQGFPPNPWAPAAGPFHPGDPRQNTNGLAIPDAGKTAPSSDPPEGEEMSLEDFATDYVKFRSPDDRAALIEGLIRLGVEVDASNVVEGIQSISDQQWEDKGLKLLWRGRVVDALKKYKKDRKAGRI